MPSDTYIRKWPKVQPNLFVLNPATIGAFWHFLGPFGAIFGVRVRFNNFFGTYLCKQSTLVLEVQPFLFVSDSATFWSSFALFWAIQGYLFLALWDYFCNRDQVQNTFLQPTNVDYQFLFWKCSPIFSFWPFCTVWALGGYFWGQGQVQKLFLGSTYVDNEL